jgi:hypothetical protein
MLTGDHSIAGWKDPSAGAVGLSAILGGSADGDTLRKALQNKIN